MIVEVFHDNVHVANITIDENTETYTALERAYFHTQNLDGSWSRGPYFEDRAPNKDYSGRAEVLVDLPVYEGRIYGLRSSMVGDIFKIGDDVYEVDTIGFKKKD